MDENPNKISPNEEDMDDPEEKYLETFDLQTSETYSKTCSRLSVEQLKRQPVRQRNKPLKKKISDFNENKRAESLSATPDSFRSSDFYILTSCCVVLCLILFGIYIYWVKSSSTLEREQLNVTELMKNLQSNFNDQPSLTYHIIERAIKRADRENPDSPGIIVLISSVKAKHITHKLADRLVKLVSDPLDSVFIDSRSSLTANGFKKEIDIVIRGNLTDKQMRAVLVKDLDEIPFEAAMMFHSYCDNDNAPFKRVIYVMTAIVEETIFIDSSKQWDVLASKRLKAVWSDSGDDQVSSLISRLTNCVAAVFLGDK